MVSGQGAQRFSVRHFSHRLCLDHGAAAFAALWRQADSKRCRRWNIGQQIREEGPQGHMAKRGTPTMGGVLIVGSVVISTLLWAQALECLCLDGVIATLLFGAIGFADDYLKMAKRTQPWADRKAKAAGAVADCDRCLGSAVCVNEIFCERLFMERQYSFF